MGRIAYVNGRYLPLRYAQVHVEDRGYQFSDGVYEVCEVFGGKIVDQGKHLNRLERSAAELRMALPMGRTSIEIVLDEIRQRNHIRNGLIYLQVTRGVAPRNHLFPSGDTKPALVVTGRSSDFSAADRVAQKGVSVITVPDNRWDRVDIKSVSLLPNVLAKQQAKETGAYEAWFVDADGMVTEGSSTNAWIVTEDNVLVTRPATRGILKGITREIAILVAESLQMKVEERHFTVEEAQNAKEAFITAATTLVMPVVEIDGKQVGTGSPGKIATQLRTHYHDYTD